MATYSESCEYEFPKQTNAEELANTLTHGMGMVLSAVGTVALLAVAVRQGSTLTQLFATFVYGLSLTAVYVASTFSHAFQQPRRKQLFRIVDQAVIYCLIAGTYTPFILLYLPPERKWPMFTIVWSLALFGFASKVFLKHRVESATALNYIMLGWLPAAAMFHLMPLDCLMWIFAGGCLYTAGAFFLTYDQQVRFFHAAWHGFVLAASAIHFFAVFQFTII